MDLKKDNFLGATPLSDGVAFKVWAPFADRVFVIGDFNQWKSPGILMNRENDGIWSQLVLHATVGHEYRYIIEYQGELLSRNDPYARDLTSSVGNSIVCDTEYNWQHTDFNMPPVDDLVIYEMHVGTFHDEPGGPPGNFYSAIDKLDHLVELGVNAIEIMPVMEFAGGFSWGYNPAYIFAVESDYGGPKALKEFIDKAHSLNLAVILDIVYNHLGPSDLGLWQFDGWQENNKGGIYFYNDWRSNTPWGETRPDFGRPMVRRFFMDNVMMWLDEFHVDGFRWDMTAFIRTVYGNDQNPSELLADGWEMMQEINNAVREQYPNKVIIAEDLHENALLTLETNDGGGGFHAQWCANFVHPVRHQLITPNDHDRDMIALKEAITYTFNNKAFERIIYTESHDEVSNGKARLPEEIWPQNADSWFSKKRSMLGAILVMTSPGIPMLFQGQEMLMDKWFTDQCPIDWNYKFNYNGIFKFYQDLTSLRRNLKNQTRGLRGESINVYHINQSDKVLAFHRWYHGGPADDVIVIINFSNIHFPLYELGIPRPGEWIIRMNTDWKKYDYSFSTETETSVFSIQQPRDQLAYSCRIHLPPYTAMILSQD